MPAIDSASRPREASDRLDHWLNRILGIYGAGFAIIGCYGAIDALAKWPGDLLALGWSVVAIYSGVGLRHGKGWALLLLGAQALWASAIAGFYVPRLPGVGAMTFGIQALVVAIFVCPLVIAFCGSRPFDWTPLRRRIPPRDLLYPRVSVTTGRFWLVALALTGVASVATWSYLDVGITALASSLLLGLGYFLLGKRRHPIVTVPLFAAALLLNTYVLTAWSSLGLWPQLTLAPWHRAASTTRVMEIAIAVTCAAAFIWWPMIFALLKPAVRQIPNE